MENERPTSNIEHPTPNKRNCEAGCLMAIVLGVILLAGCTGPRVVFVPSAKAPVRVGPGMRGRIYIWNEKNWELSRNRVPVPEGYYIWDAGDPVPVEK